jgi:predicted O-methyltransferase YrrM
MGWAEAVGPQGHVTGLEFSPEYADIAKETFTKHGIKNVEVIVEMPVTRKLIRLPRSRAN